MEIPAHFKIHTRAKADPGAVVTAEGVRFTILSDRLFRAEFSPQNMFEDRPSQIFWFRSQPVPPYRVEREGAGVVIETQHLRIMYHPAQAGEAFSSTNLSVRHLDSGEIWTYGDADVLNLKGTLRTLDGIDGQIPLENGLVSQAGWTVVDDTRGLVFNEQGWLEARGASPEYQDIYYFGYGRDYQACIQDYYKVAGPPAIVPRWVLGNWWSRYWEYSHQELADLMLDFKAHQVPLSVCIIDMDWHITKTGNASSGWTGYTWNKELFPDPSGTVQFLHDLGLRTALNLHPATGIYPHEEMYPQMAQAMGMDPASQQPVEFVPEDPTFVSAYFKYLHHPQEDTGIDFWWMDWQQGNPNRLPGLNLLWWINHIHFMDLGRKPEKRPFIFSRWGGLGNHRYPIGFSGDTIITWASLKFQPYLTATAANVGFGWWSHDIGGHMSGITDGELYTRWVQLGVFSPIMRLHSTKNLFLERRPWGYDREVYKVTRSVMQFRHMLIPYLYSMAWRDHSQGIPLARPMYHAYPDLEQAYACPNQYLFGSELLAAPFITPQDPDVRLSRQVVWLPQGAGEGQYWFDFFSGEAVPVTDPQGQWQAVYGELKDIPVFAHAGAVLPLAARTGWGGIENPEHLTLRIFPGADNQFDLYEDDGVSSAYLQGNYAITQIIQSWQQVGATATQKLHLQPVHPCEGVIPALRTVELEFMAILEPKTIEVSINGVASQATAQYHNQEHKLVVSGIRLSPKDDLQVNLGGVVIAAAENTNRQPRQTELEQLLWHFRMSNDVKTAIQARLADILADPMEISRFQVALTPSQKRALIEVLAGAGLEHITTAGEEILVMWNNHPREDFHYLFSGVNFPYASAADRFRLEKKNLPKFHLIKPAREFNLTRWGHDFKLPAMVQAEFGSFLKAVYLFNPNPSYPTPVQGWF